MHKKPKLIISSVFIYKISLFVIFLQSMMAWFFWNSMQTINILTFLVVTWFMIFQKKLFTIRSSYFLPLLLLIITELYVVRNTTFNAMILAIMQVLIVSSVFLLNNNTKHELLNFFTNAFAVILTISIFFWFLFLFGLSLPHYFLIRGDDQYLFNNYYLFLHNTNPTENLIFPRFSSIFVEPGHLGMISAFFLYANRFNLKKKAVLIIFIASILSFSLASYVLMLIAALILLFTQSRKPWLYLFLFSGLLLGIYLFFASYNNGNNVVNQLILDRLQVENGDIKGNDRYGAGFDLYFSNFIKSDESLMGIGASKFESMGFVASGYKSYLVEQGIIGTVLIFLLYFSLAYTQRSMYAWGFFLVYIASFLQRPYALWDAELFIFITALPLISEKPTFLKAQKMYRKSKA